MVKKVDRNKASTRTPTAPVEQTKAVQTSGVTDAKKVQSAETKARAGRVRRPTRPMTAEERDHLFKLIHEEADKMFGPNGLPESQRNTVEGAVRMTIDASIAENDDEEEEKEEE